MQPLNLPTFDPKIKTEGGRTKIFDPVRRKYLVLTPEEWVRQHVINFLIREKKFPGTLIGVEQGLKYNKMQKRSDIVAYAQNGAPQLIVECKAPSVKITQDVFDQIARYNMALKVSYLMVSNGLQHYYCNIDHEEQSYTYLEELPLYQNL